MKTLINKLIIGSSIIGASLLNGCGDETINGRTLKTSMENNISLEEFCGTWNFVDVKEYDGEKLVGEKEIPKELYGGAIWRISPKEFILLERRPMEKPEAEYQGIFSINPSFKEINGRKATFEAGSGHVYLNLSKDNKEMELEMNGANGREREVYRLKK